MQLRLVSLFLDTLGFEDGIDEGTSELGPLRLSEFELMISCSFSRSIGRFFKWLYSLRSCLSISACTNLFLGNPLSMWLTSLYSVLIWRVWLPNSMVSFLVTFSSLSQAWSVLSWLAPPAAYFSNCWRCPSWALALQSASLTDSVIFSSEKLEKKLGLVDFILRVNNSNKIYEYLNLTNKQTQDCPIQHTLKLHPSSKCLEKTIINDKQINEQSFYPSAGDQQILQHFQYSRVQLVLLNHPHKALFYSYTERWQHIGQGVPHEQRNAVTGFLHESLVHCGFDNCQHLFHGFGVVFEDVADELFAVEQYLREHAIYSYGEAYTFEFVEDAKEEGKDDLIEFGIRGPFGAPSGNSLNKRTVILRLHVQGFEGYYFEHSALRQISLIWKALHQGIQAQCGHENQLIRVGTPYNGKQKGSQLDQAFNLRVFQPLDEHVVTAKSFLDDRRGRLRFHLLVHEVDDAERGILVEGGQIVGVGVMDYLEQDRRAIFASLLTRVYGGYIQTFQECVRQRNSAAAEAEYVAKKVSRPALLRSVQIFLLYVCHELLDDLTLIQYLASSWIYTETIYLLQDIEAEVTLVLLDLLHQLPDLIGVGVDDGHSLQFIEQFFPHLAEHLVDFAPSNLLLELVIELGGFLYHAYQVLLFTRVWR